jgi:hypothetical protein
MRKFFLALLLGLALLVPRLGADRFDKGHPLVGQLEDLLKRKDNIVKSSPDAPKLVDLLKDDVFALMGLLGEKELPIHYQQSLQRDAELLGRVNTEKPTENDVSRLRHVAASVHLKRTLAKEPKTRFDIKWAEGAPVKEARKQEVVLESLASRSRELETRLREITPYFGKAAMVFRQLQDDVKLLRIKGGDGKMPEDYLLSVEQDSHLLSLAAKDTTPPVVAAVYFEDAAEDLHVKARAAEAMKKSPFDGVETSIETLDPKLEKPVSGYEVYFVLKGLAGNPMYYRRYPQPSTPVVESRVPAVYVMWTKKMDMKGQEDDIAVVDTGKGKFMASLWTGQH